MTPPPAGAVPHVTSRRGWHPLAWSLLATLGRWRPRRRTRHHRTVGKESR